MEREKGKAGNEWSLTEKNGEMRGGNRDVNTEGWKTFLRS
jgi:hypothetical protein